MCSFLMTQDFGRCFLNLEDATIIVFLAAEYKESALI